MCRLTYWEPWLMLWVTAEFLELQQVNMSAVRTKVVPVVCVWFRVQLDC